MSQPIETYRQRNAQLLEMFWTPNIQQFIHDSKRITNSQIFRVDPKLLCEFFKPNQHRLPDNVGECRQTLNMLRECRYNTGMCHLLGTDMKTGIIGDGPDIKRRQEVFGKHTIAVPKTQKFMNLLYSQFEDSNVIYMTWAATFYLVFSNFGTDDDPKNLANKGFMESLTIYFGLMFSCILAALCDWVKESQHLKIKDQVNDQMVTVYRGAFGTAISIPVRDIVVGDIVQLSQGDRVPADCIVLEEMNLEVDESIYGKNRQNVKKEESQYFGQGPPNPNDLQDEDDMDNHKNNPDFTLLSNSKIMKGEAKALVLCVGDLTYLARKRTKDQLILEEQKTLLEVKLEHLSTIVGKWIYFFIGVIFVVYVAYSVIHQLIKGDKKFFSTETLLVIGRCVMLTLCLLIVAIPEGLPLAISIAMAMSVDSMKKDNILIKKLESVQMCALLDEICVGKTGTLTKGDMHVASYQFLAEAKVHQNNYPSQKQAHLTNYFNQKLQISETISPEANESFKGLMRESILANSDVRMEVDEGNKDTHVAQYIAKGQALECSMINFLMENGEDVYNGFNSQNQFQEKIFQLPFDQDLKRKTVVRVDGTNDEQENCRVYVKGAPEEILPLCVQTLDQNIQPKELSNKEQRAILKSINNEIAAKCQKPLSYAFKVVNNAELSKVLQSVDEDSLEYRQIFESQLIYLGTFGIDDPLRDNIKDQVNLLQYGRKEGKPENYDGSDLIEIKMVTGDHLNTAASIAIASGIIDEAEFNSPGFDQGACAMTGETFRNKIGAFQVGQDEKGQEIVLFENPEAFRAVNEKVRVIARATPIDKFILIRGNQQQGKKIGMAGDSIADSVALKTADVGLCMGSGCDVAKDNSDLIIVDNNFESIISSIKWGRSMFENSRKFITFQFTVSFVMLTTCFISALTLGNIPFNVIQMLWINLVMDILAAIALGTGREKNSPEYKINSEFKVFLPEMWKMIIIQGIYQIIVMLVIIYAGGQMFGTPYYLVTLDTHNKGKQLVDTFLFHTLFMMTMFNQICVRMVGMVVEGNEMNVFKTLLSNPIFWLVWVAEMTLQHLLLIWAGLDGKDSKVLNMSALPFVSWIIALALGAFTLVVHIIIVKIPTGPFEKFEALIGLDSPHATAFVDKVFGKLSDQLAIEDDDDFKRMPSSQSIRTQPQSNKYLVEDEDSDQDQP